MSVIAAGNTINTAYTVYGDTTGNLVFTTGGANTVALTLSNAQAATFSGALTANSVTTTGSTGSVNSINTFGFKNRIINGNMAIDQRNAGSSITPTTNGTYCVDRFRLDFSQASKFSMQQNQGSVTLPTGYINYQGLTSLSAYSSSSGDYFLLRQAIEGLNVSDLGWGGSSAKTVTLSFQVYSSVTGTHSGSLCNSAQNRSYPFTFTVSSANTWTSISVTVPGDTTGTWLTNNGVGIWVNWNMGCGSTYLGTANAWGAAAYFGATGSVSLVGTNGATFYITGVQLEVGSQATSFDFRSYGTEFMLCQRYYETGYYRWRGYDNGYTFVGTNFFEVTKRTAPTISNGGGNIANIFVGSFMVTGSGGNFDTGNVLYTATAEL